MNNYINQYIGVNMKFKFPLLLLLSSLCNISHANPAKPQLVTNLFNQSNNFQVIDNKDNITVILPVEKFLLGTKQELKMLKPYIDKIEGNKTKSINFEISYNKAKNEIRFCRYVPKCTISISITEDQVKIDYPDPSNAHKIKVIELPKTSKLIEQAKVTWENNSTICNDPYLQVQIPKLKEKNEK